MSELSIPCPECGASIELTEALAGPMLEAERRKAVAAAERRFAADRSVIEEAAAAKARAESASMIAALERATETKDAELAKAREAELAAIEARKEAEDAKRNVDLEVARRVAEQAEVAANRGREEAAQQYEARLKAAESGRAETDAKLKAAEAAELAALKAKADAEETQRQAELTVARRLDEERGKVREQALKERDDEYRLKMSDKDRQLSELKQKLDEAQRKADQGSQQRTGDVLELDLCNTLQTAFPLDVFERIPKGQRGGDVLQIVRSATGADCGRILWESKRTKNWQEPWLAKLREDQRDARADLAALATETLPDGMTSFGERERVWVTSLATVVPVAALLRHALIETATARRAGALTDSKKDLIFAYLTGPQFRQRMTSVAETYVEMRADLDKEKRVTVKQWSTREQQLNRYLNGMAGVYGDLQGIVGASLPRVEGLSLPELESDEDDDSDNNDGSGGREVA
jgi:hypothetical protein